MTERTKKIKELISGQVDMGTFGLVEIVLLAIENENEALRQPKLAGYLFNGRFYKTLDELRGRTMSESNKPIAVFFGDE